MKQNDSSIAVILFDLDGTLLNSRDFLVQSSFDILEKNYPDQFPYEKIEADFGNGFGRLLPDKKSYIGKKSLQEFHSIKLEKYRDTIYFPGVIDGLHHLSEQGIKLGVVTNQNKQVAISSLEHYQLDTLFDVIIGLQDVEEGKPSPEGIYQAIEQLNCHKEDVLMVGDSRFDIMAGHHADVQTGFIKWYDNLIVPQDYPPTFVVDNFDALLDIIAQQKSVS